MVVCSNTTLLNNIRLKCSLLVGNERKGFHGWPGEVCFNDDVLDELKILLTNIYFPAIIHMGKTETRITMSIFVGKLLQSSFYCRTIFLTEPHNIFYCNAFSYGKENCFNLVFQTHSQT